MLIEVATIYFSVGLAYFILQTYRKEFIDHYVDLRHPTRDLVIAYFIVALIAMVSWPFLKSSRKKSVQ